MMTELLTTEQIVEQLESVDLAEQALGDGVTLVYDSPRSDDLQTVNGILVGRFSDVSYVLEPRAETPRQVWSQRVFAVHEDGEVTRATAHDFAEIEHGVCGHRPVDRRGEPAVESALGELVAVVPNDDVDMGRDYMSSDPYLHGGLAATFYQGSADSAAELMEWLFEEGEGGQPCDYEFDIPRHSGLPVGPAGRETWPIEDAIRLVFEDVTPLDARGGGRR